MWSDWLLGTVFVTKEHWLVKLKDVMHDTLMTTHDRYKCTQEGVRLL